MAWAPDERSLNEIHQTLVESTDTANREVQKNITMKLNSFTRVPDYIAYLSHILLTSTIDERIRSIAGYLLKNNARLILKCADPLRDYVKAAVLKAFELGGSMIRNAAGQDIVALMGALEPRNWPEALSVLVGMIDNGASIEIQEAAFNVLEKSCEDFPRQLDVPFPPTETRPLDFLVPKFIVLSEHPNAKMRTHAVACLSHFIPIASQSLFNHIDSFLAALFKRAADEDPDVRRVVCQSLVLMLATKPEKLMPDLNNVAEYMLYSTQDSNESVALESCEFWLTFAEDPDLAEALRPLLPKVAPVLLNCMKYGEDDLMWLDGGEDVDNAEVADRDQDIKPKFYGGGKGHGLEHEGDVEATPKPGVKSEDDEDETDADSFGSASDDDYDDEMSTEWNLRKCSAAALDVLAVRFGADLLNVLLPFLKEKLWSSDWLEKESGILALGAMAEGCIEAVEPHLNALVPFLLQSLNDGKPLVRSITCWTLGRYAGWCVGDNIPRERIEEHRRNFFVPALEGLLRMVLDNNKRVQEAGCSAFATLEEDAGPALVPFLDPVLRNLVYAFDKYQSKNTLILYDALGTLADAVGPALGDPHYVAILMPPLLGRWTKVVDSEDDLVPLLECLASVSIALGNAFLAYVGPIYEKCLDIVKGRLMLYHMWQENKDMEEPSYSSLVVALDMLSGLVQGMGMSLQNTVKSNPGMLDYLVYCLKHPEASVRQSGYALVGDMAVSCFPLLQSYLPPIMDELILQLDPEPKLEYVSACNNAAWSVGEISLRYGYNDPTFERWVPTLVQRLVPILLHPKAPRSLHENAAVSIGRIGLEHPQLVAPHLEVFAQAWCQALFEIKDNEEKDSAFRGFCRLVEINPGGIAKCFLWFCNSIVRWNSPSLELKQMFHKLLHGFKEMNPPAWEAQWQQMPLPIQQRLREIYGV